MEDLVDESQKNVIRDNDDSNGAPKESSQGQNVEKQNEASVGSSTEHGMRSYLDEWEAYFGDHRSGEGLLKKLKSKTFEDSLRTCHFRSVCWKIFLECLSEDVDNWVAETTKRRDDYNVIKERHATDPHNDSSQMGDLEQENPLSQSDSSCWLQYFNNNELKTTIDRDVQRTCPEINLFHHDRIQDLMASILFCYAREHAALSYRQGMHELLAPLIFVLHSDLQGAAEIREMGTLPDVISVLLKEEYLEHDAYAMFCQVMDATNVWYSVSKENNDNEKEQPSNESDTTSIQTVPFQPVETTASSPPLAINNKLNFIHETLLHRYDQELFQHLNRLEIIPQVYGLRWVRLLFGREFPLPELLVLWDALFADSRTLDLVDYIFVAMMFNIRRKLLDAEYCTCMRLLMKYPPIEDIYDLLKLAMHYRDPKVNKPPLRARLSSLAMQKNISPNELQNLDKKKGFKEKFSNMTKSVKNFLPSSQTATKAEGTAPHPDNQFVQTSDGKMMRSNLAGRKSKVCGLDEHDLADLRLQLSDLQEQCQFCSDKIDASIRLLQPYFLKRSNLNVQSDVAEDPAVMLENKDLVTPSLKNAEPLVALANLKQVRDILRGSLNMMEMCSPKPDTLSKQIDGLPDPPDSPPREMEEPVNLVSPNGSPDDGGAVPSHLDQSTAPDNTTTANSYL